MAKKKISKTKSLVAGIFCLIVGFFAGFVLSTYLSLPSSFAIPETKQQNSASNVVTGGIDSETITSGDLSVHFLELGNKYTGDCVLIKSGNTEMLIDAGSKTSSVSTIKEYVDQYCTDGKLEYVVVTHAHEDHYAGFATPNGTNSIFDYYEIGTIIEFAQTYKVSGTMYQNYVANRDRAENNGATVLSAETCVGNTYTLNTFSSESGKQDVTFEVFDQKFYYSENLAAAKTENNFSVCLQVSQGSNKYLFTGDLEKEGEESLVSLNQGKLGKVVLYKAGHHGSKTSSSTALLEVIRPDIVCVCCCAGSSEYTSKNENQFPTQEFVDRVSVYTCNIYVTSLCIDYTSNQFESFNGNIVVCVIDSDTAVYCSNNTTVLKDSDWFEENRTLPENAVVSQ